MKVVYVFDQVEYRFLSSKIIAQLIKDSKKSYGFKVISRDTGKEITDDNALTGMFCYSIDKILKVG